ncbi:MAG: PadR family transcriptional regulator [Anaerolineales bacterium]|nr:PadR family transcriptional regulator [Anaerolineales bacterium]
MSLRYALLGFIEMLQPVSGYDLKKWFEGSISFYWPATHTQIYRTLAELAKEKLVSAKKVEQTARPDKKMYSLTDRGWQSLTAWLHQEVDLPDTRHGLLVQLSFADGLETGEILSLLRGFMAKVRSRLRCLEQDQQQILAYGRTGRERLLWELILDSGLEYYRGELRWAEQAVRRLQEYEEKKPQISSGDGEGT